MIIGGLSINYRIDGVMKIMQFFLFPNVFVEEKNYISIQVITIKM